MFVFELSTVTPCGSAAYYSLVIRDPYVLGNCPEADIAIAHDGISDEHVSLTVLHAHEAAKEVEAATRAAADGDAATATTNSDRAGKLRYEEEDEEAEAEEQDQEREEDVPGLAAAAAAATTADEGDGDEHHNGAAAGGSDVEDNVLMDTPPDKSMEEEEKAAAAAAAAAAADEDNAARAPFLSGDHLVVRVTALPTKGSGDVRIGNVFLQPGDSVLVRDGDTLFLGDGVSGTFHYRPLMVSLEVGAYPDDYVSDLRRMFDQLGATFVDEPIPSIEVPHVPVGQLHCAEELNDSTSCLAALTYGYSVVHPTYVFEWFAAVSRRAAAPLNTLPSPSRFEVPVRCTMHPTTTMYVRPESDTCPFSLYPIPSTAMTNRSRAELFAGRVFFFFTDAAATRYWRAVEDCGGAVYGPGDVEAAKEAVRRLVDAQQSAGVSSPRLPSSFYIIIDNTAEAVLLNSGLAAASPELLAFMDDAGNACGAANLCVMGDHSLFTALLSNRFNEEPVLLTSGVPGAATPGCNDAADNLADGGHGAGGAAPVSARTPRSSYSPRYHSMCGPGSEQHGGGGGSTTARSASCVSAREQDRRNSLLPRSANRTPSRSQMRSYSRQQARSASMRSAQNDGMPDGYEAGSHSGRSGSVSSRQGRRHLVPTVAEGEMRSFAEDFDMVRVRIYAFLVREEPKLDTAIATYHRNLYVNIDGMEYALEIKAQAEDFMERVDDLLADPACHGAYTDSLRRFWRDCSDMDVKAQHLLHYWDRRFPATALPRRVRSARRASSRQSPASRSMTPRGFAVATANSPAPVNGPMGRRDGGGVSAVDGHAAATATTAASRDPEDVRAHRELYTSPEAAVRLQAEDRTEEPPLPQRPAEQVVGAGLNGVAPSPPPPRGCSTSSRQSRRRSLTPRSPPASHAGGRSAHAVPIDQRPPWVGNWAEESENAEGKAAGDEQPQPPSATTAEAYTSPQRKTPRAVQRTPAGDVAKYAPNVVRARSSGRSTSRPRRPAAEQSQQSGEEGSAVKAQDVAAASATKKAEGAAAQEEAESQVRTAPAPTPQPAPAAKPRKAATPSFRKPRAKSAAATKRSTEQNGGATNGRAAGQGRRTSLADSQSEKLRSCPPWKY